jgi:Starch-binding associating with outer membrane
MKNSIKLIFNTTVAIFSLFVSSCSKKIDEAYLNPNASTRVPVETLLPGIIGNFVGSSSAAGSAYGLANDGLNIGRYVQFWANSATGNQYDRMGGATGSSDAMGSVWAMHYYGMGQNLSKMIEWAEEEKKWDYVGVGKAIRAWGWLTTTNSYGEIILKQAFDPTRYVFTYESQEEVYTETRRLCHEALIYLNRTGDGVSAANLAKGDAYFYNGDINKWKKFVYSVLARSFNHLTNKSIYNPDSVLFYSNLSINANEDNASAKFLAQGISGTFNFMGPFRNNAGSLRQSRFIAELLSGQNPAFSGVSDPRAPYLIRENSTGAYTGVRPNKGADGLTTAQLSQNFWGGSFGTTTPPGDDLNARYIFRNNAHFPIITAAEIQFIKAEAFYRKGNMAAARQAYLDGINLSFDYLTTNYQNNIPSSLQITPAQKAAYLNNPIVAPATITLTHIMLQKYIAMYGWGLIETWTDLRRYHYTDLDPITGQQVYRNFAPPSGTDLWPDNRGALVYRCRPRFNSEFLYNIATLDAVGGRALDYHTKEQWFSKR